MLGRLSNKLSSDLWGSTARRVNSFGKRFGSKGESKNGFKELQQTNAALQKRIRELELSQKSKSLHSNIFGAYDNSTNPLQDMLAVCKQRDADQPEFMQAATEVFEDLEMVFLKDPKQVSIARFIMEPERVIKFKVPWVDDNGHMRVNRGYRIQFNEALGPYKGGLRFHPSVTESILKFLAFEQILKNSLTGFPMGGGKGGSDFDPKGKSESEIARFCQSFMTELHKYIGPYRDVPAGDIGVGGREIGYMYGQYRRLTSQYVGVFTGKGVTWGGSLIRPEATGYGCVYFAQNALKDLSGKRCVVSGSGNVAQYTGEKLIELGAIPLTFSDSSGYIFRQDGFTSEHVQQLMTLKADQNNRVSAMAGKDGIEFVARDGGSVWEVKCDIAFPSATQNELNDKHAQALAKNGCQGVFEGANMPCTADAVAVLESNGIIYGPGKAANAGGVAVSGLEMAQNAQMTKWSREEVDEKLKGVMAHIYRECTEKAEMYGCPGNLRVGANIAGFLKISEAVQQQGF